LARDTGLRSIAFPAISCGIYGYPIDQAARVASRETRAFLDGEPAFERVLLVAFDRAVGQALSAALGRS
jgi:O-acetyl-ADP-ribose deacetylase